MTAEVFRWRGGPGAGKTWHLLEDVRQQAEAGRTIEDMNLMSFSRAQAADLETRLRETVFLDADPKTVRDRCSTIDAAILRACKSAGLIYDSREQVIQPGPKKAEVYLTFMESRDLRYDPKIGTETDDDLIPRQDLPIGNQLLMIGSYLAATMQPPEAWKKAAGALGLQPPGHAWPIPDLLREWAEYKELCGVYEHSDYVRLALTERVEPRAPILYIDEFQDVSPLQNALLQQWIAHPDTERVYVAGDEDQSIYGFRGCDPALLLSVPGAADIGSHDGNRPVSHRCPVRVMEAAEKILGHAANVAPAPRAGQVAPFRPEDISVLADQIEEAIRAFPGRPVFILSRFKKPARALSGQLSAAGIPCGGIRDKSIGRWRPAKIGREKNPRETVTVDLWPLTAGIRRCLAGGDIGPIPLGEAEALITATVPRARREHALTDLRTKAKRRTVRVGDVFEWTGTDRIFSVLNLRPWIIQQVRNCIDREARRGFVIPPDMVKIDTIHSAKGLEAAVVILHTAYLDGLLDMLAVPERLAEERRVYFVGATRAEHALIITDYGGPVCPFLTEAVSA